MRGAAARILALPAFAMAAPRCAAHASDAAAWAEWNLEPWLVASLAVSAALYLGGVRTAWYANDAARWGWTPLADQQLGGLIMWVPAGVVYLVVGLALVARWLGAGRERRLVEARGA